MNNQTTIEQSAFRLPTYGQSIDWSFIRTREQYLAFRQDWRLMYFALSDLIRCRKLLYRANQSLAAKPAGNDHAQQLIAKSEKLRLPGNQWLTDNLKLATMPSMGMKVPPRNGHYAMRGHRTITLTGTAALCEWMLQLRAQSKVKSNEFWQEDQRLKTTP